MEAVAEKGIQNDAVLQYNKLMEQIAEGKKQKEHERSMLHGGGAWKSVVHGLNCECTDECKNQKGEVIPQGAKEWIPMNEAAKFKCQHAGEESLMIHDINPQAQAAQTATSGLVVDFVKALKDLSKNSAKEAVKEV